MATANNFAIHSAEIDIPYRRIWLALLTFTDDQGPTEGEAVTITIGSWTGRGTCIDGAPHGGVYSCRVVAGAGGWRKIPDGLSFQNDGNLTSGEIAQALAASVGETVEGGSEVLGTNWCFDPTVSAGSNLDEIADYYMRDDGVTALGIRPDLPTFRAIVDKFDGRRGDADLLIEDQDVASVMPGATIESDSLASPIKVRHTRILLNPNELRVEVQPHEQDPLRGARHESRKLRFLGTYRYRIIEQIAGRLQLQAVDTINGLPDQLLITKAHGLPGVTTDCASSSEVLIVFADGKRSRPFVLAYLGQGETVFGDIATADHLALAQPLIDFIVAAAPTIAAAAIVAGTATPALAVALAKYTTPLTQPLTRSGTVKASPDLG